jgi:hypothetical protein
MEQIDGALAYRTFARSGGLPTELDAEDEEAKRLTADSEFAVAVLRRAIVCAPANQVKGIAGLLQDKASIPMIQAELPLIRPADG